MAVALTAPGISAQTKFPPLPDLSFAPIGARDSYSGDRWSFMAAGPADAPAIVTLHGGGGSSMDWRFQLAGLSDRFHVVAWNAPGYMLSDGFKKEEPNCRDYADALADFLDAVKLTRVNLVGNSFGSRVAQCFAMYYPTRAIKLATVGGSAGRKGIPEAEKAQALAARREQVASGGYGFGARVEALLGPKTSPEIRELVRNGVRATNPRAFMQTIQFSLSDGYSPPEVAAVIKTPVLWISGDEDHVSPIATNGSVFQKAMPGTRLEILPDIGHLPHIEAAERVNQLLREFFAK